MIRLTSSWARVQVAFAALNILVQAAVAEEPSLHGRVVDAEKKPVAGAKVAAAALINSYIYFSNAGDVNAIAEQIGGTPADDDSRLYVRTTETDAEGKFEIVDVAGGEFGLVVSHKDRGVAVEVVSIESCDDGVEINLPKPTRVAGQLKGLMLDPKKNYVNLECESPYPWLTVSVRLNVDENGRYDSGPLPPVGKWSIVEWEWNIGNAFTIGLYKAPVDIKFGTTNTMNVDFDRGGKLRGVVTGPGYKSITNAAVIIRSTQRGGEERGAITGSDGGFEIRTVTSGRYELNVERWRLRQTPGCGPGPRDVHLKKEIEFEEGAEPLKLMVDRYVSSVDVGEGAPEFVARTLDGRELNSKELRGKVVLLDFWATWCGMCQTAVPKLKELHKELEKNGLVIVGISVDTDPKKAISFVQRHSIPWPQTALGPIDANPIARLYNVNSTPTIFLIGRDGKVIARDVPVEELESKIKSALSAK